MPEHRGDLWIANTVSDLIQGDVYEHLPLGAIPLDGDVLGLSTTTSIDFLKVCDVCTSLCCRCAAVSSRSELQGVSTSTARNNVILRDRGTSR